MTSEKINQTVENKRVKMHVFKPSMRKIWTIVGMDQEYWADPDMGFCSCAGYYFSRQSQKQYCYHLKSIKIAIDEGKYEIVNFADDEYGDFASSLIAGLHVTDTQIS